MSVDLCSGSCIIVAWRRLDLSIVGGSRPISRLSTRGGGDAGDGLSEVSFTFGTDDSSASSAISLSRRWRKDEEEEVWDRCEGDEKRMLERPRALSDNSCAAAKEKTVS